jgi:hypothetical protein
MPATSQLDRLISITTMTVLPCSKVVTERLRSFVFGMGALHELWSAAVCRATAERPTISSAA